MFRPFLNFPRFLELCACMLCSAMCASLSVDGMNIALYRNNISNTTPMLTARDKFDPVLHLIPEQDAKNDTKMNV